ncbi:BAHD acyltransferase [Pyrus ussuriensis x Pyrus communis]|uniref:BAHD acyltransferase n=1 Tax=Pyrus ussuriensis x Pyrus communis TaxID=2448454 RepID=A0A5N5GVZ8_9ROSA|nr:BAHD acyltransferase [Pyrus ussuriensis x Pyrus communis]
MTPPIEISIIARENIKPSSPTPNHLKTFKLSVLDQMVPPIYIPILLFYPTSDHQRVQQLKKSLSETLTRFYPFAGTIKDNAFIECNDDGACFIEAQVSCLLSHILNEPDHQVLKQFLPINFESSEAGKGCVLLVQANYFKGGGIAVGLCLSHKIADAATLSTFIRSWAASASGADQRVVNPLFDSVPMAPPKDISVDPPSVEMKVYKSVTKRFVFHGSKIAALKAKVANNFVENPTRVEALAALIWKCARKASRVTLGFSSRPSAFYQNVNIRNKIVPPVPNGSVGNFVGSFIARSEEGAETDLRGLIAELRKGIEQFTSKAKRVPLSEDISVISEPQMAAIGLLSRDDMDFYVCTSWCRFELYEAADFGWGKPMWVSSAVPTCNNMVILVDAEGGDGIECWIRLNEDEMKVFECDQELLSYAAFNPSVWKTG